MKRIKLCFLMLSVSLIGNVFAQNGGGKIMTSFSPKSGAYEIYYPKGFSVLEDSTGIVTMTDTSTSLNITISDFMVDKQLNDENVIETLTSYLQTYFSKKIARSDWNSYKTKFESLVEIKIVNGKTNWMWWGIKQGRRLIILSINKEEVISSDEINMVRFMMNSLLFAE